MDIEKIENLHPADKRYLESVKRFGADEKELENTLKAIRINEDRRSRREG